ncbi:hypothetical protein CISIN_1g046124mg, partial [Citrus sinensis]
RQDVDAEKRHEQLNLFLLGNYNVNLSSNASLNATFYIYQPENTVRICRNILQISIDGAIFNRCLDCFLGKAASIRNLQKNVVALETELGKLIEAKNDVVARVVNAERQQTMTRLNKVQGWLSRFGKKVAKKLRDAGTLMANGAFEVVAERAPESVADERPIEPTVVGLQLQLEHVWRCLEGESVGIVGLYGMGGVGKTTLLTHINNKFLESPTNFNYVIWVVMSKDSRLENIQETIGE